MNRTHMGPAFRYREKLKCYWAPIDQVQDNSSFGINSNSKNYKVSNKTRTHVDINKLNK
jgi:hypothetical protein